MRWPTSLSLKLGRVSEFLISSGKAFQSLITDGWKEIEHKFVLP